MVSKQSGAGTRNTAKTTKKPTTAPVAETETVEPKPTEATPEKPASAKKASNKKTAATATAAEKTAEASKAAETKKPAAKSKSAAAKKAAPTRKTTTTKKPAAAAKKTAAASKNAASEKETPVSTAAAEKATATKTAAAKKPTTAAKKTTAAEKTPAEKTVAAKKTAAAKTPESGEAPTAKEKATRKSTAKPKKAAAAKAAETEKAQQAKTAVEPATEQAPKSEPAPAAVTEKAPAPEPASAKAPEPAAKAAEATPAPEPAPAAEEKPEHETPAPEPASAGDEQAAPAEPEPQPEPTQVEEPAPQAEPAPEPQHESAPKAEPEPEPQPEPAAAEEPAAEPEPVAAPEPEPQPAPAGEFADLPGVLIAAVECAPLVKVGGLADVVGALPKYLKQLGVDARVIMPFHHDIKQRYAAETTHMCDFQARLGWRSQYVGLEKLELDGVVYYFIDNEFYFGGPIYCGGEFEGEQYAFFTRAVMDAIPQLDFNVGILHSNDWHTAMMPLLARTQYQGGMQAGLKTLLTIHNLHFQGQFSHEFDRDLLGVDDSLATPQFVEHYGCDNMLKAGIVFANKVNTVSPTYAREICEPFLGESLDGVLRSRGGDLSGILNGIDYEEWNPQTDEHLPQRYSKKSLWRKRAVKDALLYELGLEPIPEGEDLPVISMIGRLTPQKGIDLVQQVLDQIMAENVRVIVLGSGYGEFENYLRDAENRYKGRLCSYIGYNGDLAHRIYAGSDLFLMPSLFEPCGISQLIAMRYGTLPIVRETGGLRDTVIPYNEFTGEGTGFSFANYNAYEMLDTIRRAIAVWWNEPVRKQLMAQAMDADFGFERCARSYAELYRSL